ncbi:MAG: acetyl-CoA carboxylase biotin carboxyl carrier protein [candidate division Zixibacteria bacterium]|nr:acetyl-CoA carboxylase biotin carboxyl carrier protein [candidate division Zixibacteria bacterium]
MFVNEKYIRKLIQIVEESDIESIEVSSWGRKVKINHRQSMPSNGHSTAPALVQTPTPPRPAPAADGMPEPVVPTPEVPAADETGRYTEIKSPMVGTFYAAPAPDAPPYVSADEKISVGQVVCIVEAMKLMNEIESEVSGRVIKVLVENAQLVEFGQAMFLIDPEG